MKRLIVAVVTVLALSLCTLPVSVFAGEGGGLSIASNETSNTTSVDFGNYTSVEIGNSTSVSNSTSASVSILIPTFTPIANKQYTGKDITPNPVLKSGKYTLVKGTDYTISYANNTNVGTAKITITGKGSYYGTRTIRFNIVKATNAVKKYTSKKAVKLTTLNKKKKITFKIAATAKFSANKTYKLVSVSKKAKKYIAVSKNGTVTLKKGLKKSTYKVKVRITASSTTNYKALKVTKTIRVTVK